MSFAACLFVAVMIVVIVVALVMLAMDEAEKKAAKEITAMCYEMAICGHVSVPEAKKVIEAIRKRYRRGR